LSQSEKISGKEFVGINLSLYKSFESFRDMDIWSKPTKQVCDFLAASEANDRRIFAENLIKHYWDDYGKQEAYAEFFKKMIAIEQGTKKFKKSHRDHITHSAYVFLLGIYLYSFDEDIQEAIEQKCVKLPNILDKFLFMWSIISTFHDIGYPFDIFSKEMKQYLDMINESGKEVIDYEKTSFKLEFNNIDSLLYGKNSFDLMNELQKSNDSNHNFLNLNDYFNYKLEKGLMDHGVLSALILLKITDVLYEDKKEQWPREDFENFFPEIALAIALHNINWNEDVVEGMEIPKDNLPEITLTNFPFCYLLILADTLQEWDRPSLAKPSIPSTGVSIDYNGNEEKFEVKFALSDKKVEDINKELNDKISESDDKELPSIKAAL